MHERKDPSICPASAKAVRAPRRTIGRDGVLREEKFCKTECNHGFKQIRMPKVWESAFSRRTGASYFHCAQRRARPAKKKKKRSRAR
jgi:hypothetical protein